MDREQQRRHRDDEDWLALLAGKSVPDAHPDTVKEAQELRRAIQAEAGIQPEPVAEQAGLERLLGRLEQEGLLQPRRQAWWQVKQWRSTRWTALAAAALVVCMLPWVIAQLTPESVSIVKSERHVLQVLYAPEPRSQARALQSALTGLGITVEYRDLGDSHSLKARLPQPLREAVRQVLEQYKLTAPADGMLIVEILPTAP